MRTYLLFLLRPFLQSCTGDPATAHRTTCSGWADGVCVCDTRLLSRSHSSLTPSRRSTRSGPRPQPWSTSRSPCTGLQRVPSNWSTAVAISAASSSPAEWAGRTACLRCSGRATPSWPTVSSLLLRLQARKIGNCAKRNTHTSSSYSCLLSRVRSSAAPSGRHRPPLLRPRRQPAPASQHSRRRLGDLETERNPASHRRHLRGRGHRQGPRKPVL